MMAMMRETDVCVCACACVCVLLRLAATCPSIGHARACVRGGHVSSEALPETGVSDLPWGSIALAAVGIW
jgi:hypothetical protein